MDEGYDYIVVGAGTGGGVVASLLSFKYGFRVLLLEAGSNENENPVVYNVLNALQAQTDPRVSDVQVGQPDPTLGGQSVSLYQGRALGGSLAHNGAHYVRPSPSYFQRLQCLAGPKFDYQKVTKALNKLETYIVDGGIPSDPCRGECGPMPVTELPVGFSIIGGTYPGYAPPPPDPSMNQLLPPALLASWPFPLEVVPDYNLCADACISLRFQVTASRCGPLWNRSHTGVNFVCPAARKSPLKVKCRQNVEKVLLERAEECNFRAVGVKVGCKLYLAKCGVILAAGAIYTPCLLQRSGIGPRKVLECAGVEPMICNENVGRHLHNHYGPSLVASVSASVARGSSVQAWVQTPSSPFPRTFQFYTAGFSPLPPDTNALLGLSPPPPGLSPFSFLTFNVSPYGEGSVEIVSPDPFNAPRIVTNAFSDPRDLLAAQEVLVALDRVVKELAVQNPSLSFSTVFPPPSAFSHPADLTPFIESSSISNAAYHMTGTARIDPTGPTLGVVDEDFLVYGTSNLWIADNSVWPISPDGNTAAPALLAGYLLAVSLGRNKERRKRN